MANTLLVSDYMTRTRNKLNRSSYDSNKLIQFADEANKEICNNRRWRFMEKNFSGDITANETNYDLVSDYQAAINFVLIDPDNKATYLKYMPYEVFDQEYPDPLAMPAATPSIWTVFGASLVVGPAKPDQNYTLRLRYLKAPVNLTAVGNTPDITDDFAEIMTIGMTRRALEASDMYNQAQVLYQEWQDLMDAMEERLMSRQYGEPVRMNNQRRRNG